MGFQEAIEGSGWDDARRNRARQLCDDLRDSLRPDAPPVYERRIYDNLDTDPLILDTGDAGTPATRPQFLGELLDQGPPACADPLFVAARDFCHGHKQEGPRNEVAEKRVLGKALSFGELLKLYQRGKTTAVGDASALGDIIATHSLAEQRDRLEDTALVNPRGIMWSFYDPADEDDPYASLEDDREEVVDRLGLGWHEGKSHRILKLAHRLPDGMRAFTPTAWDGGVRHPYWYPGGRTRPLSADGRGTGRFGDDDGLPEVVHAPLTGRQLAAPIEYVTDTTP